MYNDPILNAIYKYTLNKNDQSFDVKIIRILIHIYNEIDIINPFLVENYDLIFNNIKKYGLSDEELQKFKDSLKLYMQYNEMDAMLTLYKILIDMIVKKHKDTFISKEEVAEYEKFFFQGKCINSLNKYWDKALYKINNKIIFKENNNNIFNPYAYYLQGKTLADIKEMSDEKLYYLNRKILKDYNIKIDDKNVVNKLNKAINKIVFPKQVELTTGNGFVDILTFISFVATEIMVGIVIAVQFIMR